MGNKETPFQLENRKARLALSRDCNMFCTYCRDNNTRQQPGAMEDFRARKLKGEMIGVDEYIAIIQALYDVGFRGITLTGGEPLLNPNWDTIVREASRIGMQQICLTTNGTLTSRYLDTHGKFPDELTLITVSFDTFDEGEFERITRTPTLPKVIEGLRRLKETNPRLTRRANKVVMRSNFDKLPEFLDRCDQSGLFNEVNLLNLILKKPYDPREVDFFKQQFVYPDEIIAQLSQHGYVFTDGEKYEPQSISPKGTRIIVKDTNRTLRVEEFCNNCPIYCQEGFYTVRVGTDGAIRTCIDYRNELSYIDGKQALTDGTLRQQLAPIVKMFQSATLENTLEIFIGKHT